MQVRTRDRLKALEAEILPKGRAFVFVFFSGEGSSRADQLAAFKAENGVCHTIDARQPLREFQQTTGHTPVDPGLAAPVAQAKARPGSGGVHFR